MEAGVAGSAPGAINVGERLRTFRRRRRLTLKAIADRAGVSESFLSQVERGRTGASLMSLQRIAHALGVSVADLFEPDGGARPQVLRAEDRPVLSFGKLEKHLLTPRPLENLEVIVGVFDPGGSTGDEPYTHGDSEELCVVLSGRIEAQIGSDFYEMGPGDSIDYRSSMLHNFRNVGTGVAEVMWIISPPSY
jgi:transcriptional regulator with XRE-family HTH domain